MVIKDVVIATKLALENMNKNYCKLSIIDYKEIKASNTTIDYLKKEKYLERPLAYEFFHQLRGFMDTGVVDFGEPIIQAEVDKRYQNCFEKGKMPDFIIHLPNSKKNLAVIEFKLAKRGKNDLKEDFKKIVEFKTNSDLMYLYGIEVLLGPKRYLEKRKRDINNWNEADGEEIIIFEFDTDSWEADHSVIHFKE